MVLLCCGNAKVGGEGGERVMEKWNTLWKQACTRKKTKPSGPARASSYPNTQQKGGKTNNHKKKIKPQPPPFFCVPLSHAVYCRRPITFYLAAYNISVNNQLFPLGELLLHPAHSLKPHSVSTPESTWSQTSSWWALGFTPEDVEEPNEGVLVSCAQESGTSDFPGLLIVTGQHRGTLKTHLESPIWRKTPAVFCFFILCAFNIPVFVQGIKPSKCWSLLPFRSLS